MKIKMRLWRLAKVSFLDDSSWHLSFRQIGIFLFLFFTFTQVNAQSNVRAEVDSLHMLIGDQMPLHLTIKTPVGAEIRNIDLTGFDEEETLEVVRMTEMDSTGNGGFVEYKQDIFMTAFDSGRYYVPKIPVSLAVNGTVQTLVTNDIPIEVQTIQTDSTFLAPNKDIIEEPFRLSELLPYAIGLAVLLGLVFLANYFMKRNQQKEAIVEEVIIKRPAHEIAFGKLGALKAAKLWQQGEVKKYQSELTYIGREYLENRYEVQALESTTDEILKDLKQIDIPTGFEDKLREMLQLADMVKFAKADPPIEVHDRLWNYADEFVKQTKYIKPITAAKTDEDENDVALEQTEEVK